MSVLDTLDFQPMLITDVFESMAPAGKWFDLTKAKRNGALVSPYVARSGGGNGIGAFLPDQGFKAPNAGNAITIGVSTSTVFYQPVSFYTSKEIQVLRHPRLTSVNAPVLVALLREQMMKFQWGNGASIARLQATPIMVPVITHTDGTVEVDWDGMDLLGAELLDEVVSLTHNARLTDSPDDDTFPELNFEPMPITDVFTSYRQAPAWLNTNQVQNGEPRYPHVTNTARRNSVAAFISRQGQRPNPGNAITVGIDTQVVSYQPVPFYGATKVFELRAPELNENNAFVLVTSLKQAISKFSWGHKASSARLQATRIMVATTTDTFGKTVVDWEGMTRYGRVLRTNVGNMFEQVLEHDS
ncbi:restriction endonuclease subunit S [Corynebacterium sp. SCR221107]|uniref:restriction endonuclease subunit S n=1 Tax=Corynebacterium sp. SCR221107 TaxID=3017361 RepID=UPI0022EC658C|nr:restriction endonuclease subunit S [Corynebacterium sp. SCR221107]WBT09413.1 restriction endonuclease subunit S [Corynebacterium sp. SCR221107]